MPFCFATFFVLFLLHMTWIQLYSEIFMHPKCPSSSTIAVRVQVPNSVRNNVILLDMLNITIKRSTVPNPTTLLGHCGKVPAPPEGNRSVAKGDVWLTKVRGQCRPTNDNKETSSTYHRRGARSAWNRKIVVERQTFVHSNKTFMHIIQYKWSIIEHIVSKKFDWWGS